MFSSISIPSDHPLSDRDRPSGGLCRGWYGRQVCVHYSISRETGLRSSSMLVILRDRGLPLPAGGILISPWVDLTHSFPSVAGDNSHDYIPAHGFLQRPSSAWPPPNSDDMEIIAQGAIKQIIDESLPRISTQETRKQAEEEACQGFSAVQPRKHLDPKKNVNNPAGTDGASDRPGNTIPGPGHDLSIMLDGKLVIIKDQIQMYTTNQLIAHPLVSPVLQPSLGGLPPLLIMTGGGEVLRDEQIYLAHKAANPSKYPPGEAYLDRYPEAREIVTRWRPTDVQLQVWDDLCHVAPTLSFTRPAKYMFRSVAQFGAWILARAQKTVIEIQEDDEISIISSGSKSKSSDSTKELEQIEPVVEKERLKAGIAPKGRVGKAGQPLPPFKNHMVRQRVDRHGNIFDLGPPSSLPALKVSSNEIGIIKPGPVSKWLNAKKVWDHKYAREKRKVQTQRAKEMAQGFQSFGDDEVPPPSALAGRRGLTLPKEEKKSRSWLMSLWSSWGSTHDGNTIEREENADKEVDTTVATVDKDGVSSAKANKRRNQSRSKSRRRSVAYNDQNDGAIEETSAAELIERRASASQLGADSIPPPQITTEDTTFSDAPGLQPTSPNRPSLGDKAFPFKLGTHLTEDGHNASTVTLMSQGGVVTPKGDEKSEQLGEAQLATEDRRMTVQDSDGVLHKAVTKKEMDDGDVTPKMHVTGKQLGEDDTEEVARRPTMQDSDGVLHKALPQQEAVGSTNSHNKTTKERPGIERFETAKEDL